MPHNDHAEDAAGHVMITILHKYVHRRGDVAE